MKNNWLAGAEKFLKGVSGIIICIDENGVVRFINDAGAMLLGFPAVAITGQQWVDQFISLEFQEEERERLNQVLDNGIPPSLPYENTLRAEGGNTRFIRWYHAGRHEEQQMIMGVILMGEDITEEKILLKRLHFLEEVKRQQLLSAVLEAQERERSEIAYELHDNVNQILTTCKLLLEQEVHNGNQSPFIQNTTSYIQNAIDEVRNISHRLNPAHLGDMSFDQAILEITNRINLAGKIRVEVSLSGHAHFEKIPSLVALSVIRILQEHLTNVIRHAKATKAGITIHADTHSLDMEINDDGVGFDLKTTARGLGLKSIYSRVELHKGSVYFNTAPGYGCSLSVYIPFQ